MKVTIIADASWCPHESVGGYGFWIASERGKLGGGGELAQGKFVESSHAAEMMALCNALFIALGRDLVQQGDEVLLQTDCMAAIDAFQDRRVYLAAQEHAALKYMKGLQRGHKLILTYRHVKGHTSNPNARSVTNRLCDERAKTSMRVARARAQQDKRIIAEGEFYVPAE